MRVAVRPGRSGAGGLVPSMRAENTAGNPVALSARRYATLAASGDQPSTLLTP
jgi:hypothetical protein